MGNKCSAQGVKETQLDLEVVKSPRKDGTAVEAKEEVHEDENLSFDEKLQKVLKLPLPFVDGQSTIKPEGLANCKEIAALLQQKEAVCLRILDFTGQGLNLSKQQLEGLSLDRARAIREALKEEGCKNKIAARGMGSVDGKGAHCLLEVCTAAEADAIEASLAVMLQSSEAGLQPASAELVFSMNKQVVIMEGEQLLKPYNKDAILRAWFGEPGSEWQPGRKKGGGCFGGSKKAGVDVTLEVKELLEKGGEIRADAKLFSNAAKQLAPGAKALLLEVDQKEERTITFYTQPLGINFFMKKSPLVVKSFPKDSLAMSLGVRTGWALQAVNGKDLSTLTYDEAIASAKETQSTLPGRDALPLQGSEGAAKEKPQNPGTEQKLAESK